MTLSVIDRYERMNQVVEIYIKGQTDPGKIAKELNMKRAEVMTYIAEYRQIAANDPDTQLRAREALMSMDKHYNMIIEELWETVRAADFASELRVKGTTLKAIADVEKIRLDSLQKAGVFNDQALADQIAEMEAQRDVLVGIIKDVASQCTHCRGEVARRLSKLGAKPEPIDITESVVVGEMA